MIESISRKILDLDQVTFSFKVGLGSKDRYGKRRSYKTIQEYKYDRYNIKDSLKSMYINPNLYLIMYDKSNTNNSVYFTYSDIVSLVSIIKKVYNWKKEKIWFREDKSMYIDLGENDPKNFVITYSTFFEDSIIFNPSITKIKNSEKDMKAVEINIHNKDLSYKLNFNEVKLFATFISKTDFINLSQQMINLSEIEELKTMLLKNENKNYFNEEESINDNMMTKRSSMKRFGG